MKELSIKGIDDAVTVVDNNGGGVDFTKPVLPDYTRFRNCFDVLAHNGTRRESLCKIVRRRTSSFDLLN